MAAMLADVHDAVQTDGHSEGLSAAPAPRNWPVHMDMLLGTWQDDQEARADSQVGADDDDASTVLDENEDDDEPLAKVQCLGCRPLQSDITCIACIECQPNQLAHMGPGGCMAVSDY